MTIWLLAIILVASLAGLGYRQGAIRVGFSFIGILMGAALAVPLGRLVGKLLVSFGIKDPLVLWAVGPLVVFVVVSIIFKSAAAAVHHKVDVHYKYHAGDLRLALWERLNQRVGLCLGMLNAAAYLVLISFVIYAGSYATYQFATSEKDPAWMRLLNRMGKDLQATGFAKVARSIDTMPQIYFDMTDFAAVIYHNSLLEARLSRYPGLLSLAERQEFQDMANDKEFTEMRQRQEPVMVFWDNVRILAIRSNPEMLRIIWNTVAPDLGDVRVYLKSGQSAKYDPIKILGRWYFDVNGSMMAMRRAKPTIPASEMQKVKRWMTGAFNKTMMVARPDNRLAIKNLPPLSPAATVGVQSFQGEWKDLDAGKYSLSWNNEDLAASVEGDRLNIKAKGMDLVFLHED
jgi:hypothetical protein